MRNGRLDLIGGLNVRDLFLSASSFFVLNLGSGLRVTGRSPGPNGKISRFRAHFGQFVSGIATVA
jgi:hypothetical protein